MISQHVYRAYLVGSPDVELSLRGGKITLDDATAPHVQANIDVAAPGHWETVPDDLPTAYGGLVWVPDDELLGSLDPRLSPRVRVTTDATYPTFSTSRYFDLGVRDLDPSQTTRVVSLKLASDEAILEDYSQLTDDPTPFTLAASLRGVVNYVLGRAITLRRNLAHNPWPVNNGNVDDWQTRFGWSRAFSGDAAYFTCQGGTQASFGRGFDIRGNYDAPPGGSGLWTSIPISAGGAVYLSVQAGTTRPDIRVRASVRLHDGAGNWIEGQTAGPWVSLATGWQRVGVAYVAPADGYIVGRVEFEPGFLLNDGDVLGAQQMLIEPGTLTYDGYFDGHSNPGAGTRYDGAPAASTSRWTAALESSPAVDADLTPYWPVTNLMPNPAVRAVVGNWIAGGANGSLTRETGWSGVPADPSITTGTATAFTGNSGLGQGGAVAQTASTVPYAPVSSGKKYTVYCWALSTVAKQVRLAVQVFGADGAVLSGGIDIATANLQANSWALVKGEVEMPANASRIGPFLYAASGVQWTAGQNLRTTAWMVHEGTYPVTIPWFDGAKPSDTHYDYVPSGAAHASATTRTPKHDATDPDALTWRAGTSAIEFLRPLVQKAGFRLVCDEQRRWTLRDENYVADGALNVRYGVNLIDGSALISRVSGLWFDGRVTRYRWTDRDGIQRERDDAYALTSSPTLVSLVEVDSAYPGPGRSQYAVRRAQTRGREVTVAAVADWRAQSEQAATFVLDGAPTQFGSASRIEFDLGPGNTRDRMTITARTVDLPEGAWILGTPDESWLEGPTPQTWLEAG